jgi:putative YhbY family RNA-binding protein
MADLSPARRRELKASAHALDPVVFIGGGGLSAAVIAEIDRSLKSHELIKVRVNAERAERDAMFQEICRHTGAQPVQHIGKILVLFRENPESPYPGKSRVVG